MEDMPGDMASRLQLSIELLSSQDVRSIWISKRSVLNPYVTKSWLESIGVADTSRSKGEYKELTTTSTAWQYVDYWTFPTNEFIKMLGSWFVIAVIYDAGTVAADWQWQFNDGKYHYPATTFKRTYSGEWQIMEMGIVKFEQPTEEFNSNALLRIQAKRSSGTEPVRLDFVFLLRADEEMAILAPSELYLPGPYRVIMLDSISRRWPPATRTRPPEPPFVPLRRILQ